MSFQWNFYFVQSPFDPYHLQVPALHYHYNPIHLYLLKLRPQYQNLSNTYFFEFLFVFNGLRLVRVIRRLIPQMYKIPVFVKAAECLPAEIWMNYSVLPVVFMRTQHCFPKFQMAARVIATCINLAWFYENQSEIKATTSFYRLFIEGANVFGIVCLSFDPLLIDRPRKTTVQIERLAEMNGYNLSLNQLSDCFPPEILNFLS